MSVRKVYDVLVDGKCVFSGSKAMAYEVYYSFQRYTAALIGKFKIDDFLSAPDGTAYPPALVDSISALMHIPTVTIAFQPPAREEAADGRGIFL